ncbi:hypothetical protein KP509_36G050500 [Ceratopteris richardii]|nr:hypothetical protein KP509_36G050500 [Ceratopteris richardii]
MNALCQRGNRSHQEDGGREGAVDCAVCLCEFERGQELRITPNCCHVFHRDCIHRWLDQEQRTCPLCRTSIVRIQTSANVQDDTVSPSL